MQHVRPVNDDGHTISRDLHGIPVTCRWIKLLNTNSPQVIMRLTNDLLRCCLFFSGGYHDSMVVLKQESRFARANDRSFTRVIHFYSPIF